jgi:hypothetical protein
MKRAATNEAGETNARLDGALTRQHYLLQDTGGQPRRRKEGTSKSWVPTRNLVLGNLYI